MCIECGDNELAHLEAMHNYVEALNSYFDNVCELDLVYNVYKVRHQGSKLVRRTESMCRRTLSLISCLWRAKFERQATRKYSS